MSDKPDKRLCSNCGETLIGKFCHACGEKRRSRKDMAMSNFLKEVFRKFTHLDSQMIRSLFLLVAKPGFLTVEYLRGRQKPYEKPLTVFLTINLIYFLTIGFNGYRTYENPLSTQLKNPYQNVVIRLLENRFHGDLTALSLFEIRFDHQVHMLSKSMLLLMVPMYAAGLWLLYRSRKMYFGEHLITALHLHALMLVLNMFMGIVAQGMLSRWLIKDPSLMNIMTEFVEPFFWAGLVMFFTIRRVYPESMGRMVLKALLMCLMWAHFLILYRFLVFLCAFYTV
jgi:hypothetical protein